MLNQTLIIMKAQTTNHSKYEKVLNEVKDYDIYGLFERFEHLANLDNSMINLFRYDSEFIIEFHADANTQITSLSLNELKEIYENY